MLKVLVVDDDPVLRFTIKKPLIAAGHQAVEAEDGEQAVRIVTDQGPFDAVILDVNMPKMNGIDALEKIKALHPKTLCIIATAFSQVEDARKALKLGAYDYLEKPVKAERLIEMIEEGLSARGLVEKVKNSLPQMADAEKAPGIVGESEKMHRVFELINKLAKVDTSVLIRGESGTGKELVAQALHFNSHRKKGPFVAINCAAIPENLIESELFGHEKGSFTGADKKKIGKFQFAQGGTIFLDEIGDMGLNMQVKLLRVLQEKLITPVGGNAPVKVDVRIVAATSRPLEKMIETGTFREDLFYRLSVLPVRLPALRERSEDIASLCDYFIKKFNSFHDRNLKGIEREALKRLQKYRWPGNIRELENVIEHAFILEPSDILTVDSLPEHILSNQTYNDAYNSLDAGYSPSVIAQRIQGAVAAEPEAVKFGDISSALSLFLDVTEEQLNYPVLKEEFEKQFLLRALKIYHGRINKTALKTNMTKVTLLRKLEKYEIDPRQFY